MKFEGEYLNGKRNGKGIEYDIWRKKENIYLKGKKLKFEGEYFKGAKWNGKIKEYYDNDKIQFEGEYKFGEKNGTAKEYDIYGNIVFIGKYFNGKRLNVNYRKYFRFFKDFLFI